MSACSKCGRELSVGESVTATDWKVLKVSGTQVTTRWETRYTCDDCEVAVFDAGDSGPQRPRTR